MSRYQRATVDIDGSVVTIMPRRAPVGDSAPIRGHTFAVLPDPQTSDTAPSADVSVRSSHLHQLLLDRGHPLFFGTVEPGGRPATAVLDLDQPEALAIGRAAGLIEILFWDGRRAHLLACNP